MAESSSGDEYARGEGEAAGGYDTGRHRISFAMGSCLQPPVLDFDDAIEQVERAGIVRT
jgi:hypothetical protein